MKLIETTATGVRELRGTGLLRKRLPVRLADGTIGLLEGSPEELSAADKKIRHARRALAAIESLRAIDNDPAACLRGARVADEVACQRRAALAALR